MDSPMPTSRRSCGPKKSPHPHDKINVDIQPLLQKSRRVEQQPSNFLGLSGSYSNRIKLEKEPELANEPFDRIHLGLSVGDLPILIKDVNPMLLWHLPPAPPTRQ
eukprot:3611327-Pyramimonas_sp.AAC.1